MKQIKKQIAEYLINSCDFNSECIDTKFINMIIKICEIPNIDVLIQNPNHIYHRNKMGLLEPNEIRYIKSLLKIK